ncbi:MAG TPA: hypothetical protein VHX59_24240 [Mycobacteriales bacterium]|nr:hypothetical protein [Mycobacteriales bacterium]
MTDLEQDCTARRIGLVMEPDPDDPREVQGVLNPAAARGRDGELYLFPRLVGDGNYSRIGRARVLFDSDGAPTGVERLGLALEPGPDWERNSGGGGVEDPRVTRLDALDRWVMSYTAFGPLGPRVALALSGDLVNWHRIGPIGFDYEPDTAADFNLYANKDAILFPEPVTAPDGRRAFALLHRPTYRVPVLGEPSSMVVPDGVQDDRESIWISFAPVTDDPRDLLRWGQHRLLAVPERPWEAVKIGGGTVPWRTSEGWMLVYHGVASRPQPGVQRDLCYSAGAMLLDHDDVTRVLWRATDPVLDPQTDDEMRGMVSQVVFPTAADCRPDGSTDIYYGMADSRIGVARIGPGRFTAGE